MWRHLPLRTELCLGLLALVGCSDAGIPTEGDFDGDVDHQCPSHLKLTFLAGNRSDVGWTGALHGTTLARGAFARVEVVECDAECRLCAFEGPVRDQTVITQRCVTDTAMTCSADADCPEWQCRPLVPEMGEKSPLGCAQSPSTSCGSPADCGRSGSCRFFVGPSFPVLAPRTCTGSYFVSPDEGAAIRGTIDLLTGQVDLERVSIVVGGVNSAIRGSCPKCVGDLVPNDGAKDGVCVQNDVEPWFEYDRGQPCDTHGIGVPALFDGGYSLDCTAPLGVLFNVGMSNGSSNGRRLRLTENQPICDSKPCWCGVCENTYEPCHDDSDCRGVSCIAPTDGIPTRANSCKAGSPCQWDEATQTGQCIREIDVGGGKIVDIPTSCFPDEVGAEIIARGRSRVISDTSYSVEIGSIQCASPLRALAPTSPIWRSADIDIGLPGLQINVYHVQVDKE